MPHKTERDENILTEAQRRSASQALVVDLLF